MSDSNNRKIGVILTYISIALTTLIQLIYTPFLIRFLGQSEYGLFSLVNSIIGYLTIFDLGFGNAIVVYTTKYHNQKQYEKEKKLHGMFKIVFIIIALITLLFGLIIYFSVDNMFGSTMSNIELEKTKTLMIILLINLFITFSFNIYSSILNAYEKFVYQKVISIISTIIRPLVMIPMLFLGYKSICMALIITVVNLIVALSNYLYCIKKMRIKIKFYGFDKSLFITIFGYSFWIFLASIVDRINWSLDHFILGIVSGTTAVSIYSLASNINALFTNLSTAISGVLLPKITKMISNNCTKEELTDEFIKVGRLQFYIMFLTISGFVLVGKEFVVSWAGIDYENSYYITLCLAIPAIVVLIQNVGLSIMQAMNKFKFKAIATFIMSLFNIVISFYLAKKYGAVGAALGTTISIVICNIVIMNIYYYRVIGINIIKFWKNILTMFLKYLVLSLMIGILIYNSSINGFSLVLLYGTLYLLLYILVSYLFVMNKYEKGIINKFINTISRRRCKNGKKVY